MSLMDQLPVLLVIVPLLSGVLTLFTRGTILPWAWATANIAVVFVIACYLFCQVHAHPEHVVEYMMGSWPSEYGIGYRIDALNAFVLVVVTFIALVTTFYARLSIASEIPNDRLNLFYALWLMFISGLLGITITGDAFNIYVLLEISSLTVYALIAMGKDRDRRALTASLRYLILGSVGASFILLGIGYLLMITGTLNIIDMHNVLSGLLADPEQPYHGTILVAFAFLVVGLSLKMALFPLHMWLPNAYTYAPSAVSALVAATATKVGVYMAIRFLFTVFGVEFSFGTMSISTMLLWCAAIGVVVTGIQACRQSNVKAILAYSSLGQICYIVMGFALHNQNGLTGATVHILNHALMKGGLFLAIGCVVYRVGGCQLKDIYGLGRKMPWTMAAFTAGGLGLIGFPLTAGFISKWYLLHGALDAGLWPLAVVVLFGSLLAVIYIWRLLEAIYFKPAPEQDIQEAPLSMLIPTWILIGASLYVGIFAESTTGYAAAAAKAMLGTY